MANGGWFREPEASVWGGKRGRRKGGADFQVGAGARELFVLIGTFYGGAPMTTGDRSQESVQGSFLS
jgi:hypothetical protein